MGSAMVPLSILFAKVSEMNDLDLSDPAKVFIPENLDIKVFKTLSLEATCQ
jgi:hypothetical protein